MRILYVSQYYPPEMGAPSARVSELARAWTESGHEVTVLTAFPQHPMGVKRPGDRRVLTRREKDGAIDIVRAYIFAARNAGFLWRTFSYVTFMLSAILVGIGRVRRPQVVIATSPQLFTAVAGWALARWFRVPFIFEVRDLWPESIVEVGAMRPGWAIALVTRLAQRLYRAATRIVTVGEGYKRRLVRLHPVPASKVDIVTNGVELDRFTFNPRLREQVRAGHGWRDEYVVLYLGTHGMAHGLESVLEAAARLGNAARFVLVGDGAEKPRLEQRARDLALTNVEFHPPQDKDSVIGYYAASDCCLVPLRRADLFTDVLPSKLFEIMAMERPILLSVDGEARREVERAGAGWFVEPEAPVALARAITKLQKDPDLAHIMGRSGRRHVERHFSRTVLARKYLRILDTVVDGTPPAAPLVLPLPAPRRRLLKAG